LQLSWCCLLVQLAETLLNEELEVDRRFELCFEELRKGKLTFQALTLPIKQAWCDLLRRWLRRWGAEPAFDVPLPDNVTCKGNSAIACFLFAGRKRKWPLTKINLFRYSNDDEN